jgi:proline utilization trans-activator
MIEALVRGIVGIEVVALTALYLQIADQKEEAYVQVCPPSHSLSHLLTHLRKASLALHLAIAQNMHRAGGDSRLSRSEAVHRNRLWWSVYMQQR